MSNRNRRRGFSKTHQTCPCPDGEKKCFSVFADDPESGYCHACARVVIGTRRASTSTRSLAMLNDQHPQVFIPHATVTESTFPITGMVDAYVRDQGYQDAFTGYAELRSEGLDHLEAFQVSGYMAYADAKTPDMAVLVCELPEFVQQIYVLTGMPELLTAFHIGIAGEDEAVFWMVDPLGRVCNAQIVPYRGLSRCTRRHTRFMYKTADGYRVTAFFGSEQLRPGACSWLKRPFDQQAPVVIVESPKSALLASLLHPEAIWLASCGVSGVSPAKATDLRGREVKILFDNDDAGYAGARRAQRVLLEAGAFPQIIDPNVLFGGTRPDGWDIGDEAIQILRGHA